MKYKIIKLDRRYSYNTVFSHIIEFYKGGVNRSTGVLDYDRACRWFNANFGWSADVDVQNAMRLNRRAFPNEYTDEDFNWSWAYCEKYNDYRIYVKSEKELEWFLLANPNET